MYSSFFPTEQQPRSKIRGTSEVKHGYCKRCMDSFPHTEYKHRLETAGHEEAVDHSLMMCVFAFFFLLSLLL